MTTTTTIDQDEAAEAAEAADGEEAGEETRRFERRLPHQPEKVWRALTEAKELAAWFPVKVDNDIADRSDGDAALSFQDKESGEALEGKVLEMDPPRLLRYSMGEETLQFELAPIPEGCLLTLTTTVTVHVIQAVHAQHHAQHANDNSETQFKCAA